MQTVQAYSNWEVGQKCQVLEWKGIHIIDRLTVFNKDFVQAHVIKLKRDGSRSVYNTTVTIEKLMSLEAKQPTTDLNGLTAEQFAKEEFKANIVMFDLCRSTCQSLMKVINISKSGRVKVQRLQIIKGATYQSKKVGDQIIRSQEVRTINWMNLEYKVFDETETFTPRLYEGKWAYWHGEGYIQAAGMKLEQFLD